MEHLSIQLEASVAKQIRKDLREFHYSTKTEFIRESIRDKLRANEEQRRKKKSWEALFAARGSLKGQGKAKTYGEYRAITEKAAEEFIAKLEKKLAQK